jgi:hypothetical protein
VVRFLAGAAACFLFMTGAFLFWQSRAQQAPLLPPPPPASVPGAPSMVVTSERPVAPEASPKTREQKRFARADKDDNGRIERAEMLEPRRKAFAKLDRNGDGQLSFAEWGIKTIQKFDGADRDRSQWLSPAEFATTAPPPPKKKRCSC